MENKINVAELLKDCPKGMELDCINYDGIVTFEEVTNCDCYPIKISIKYGNESFNQSLTRYGQSCRTSYNKCVIFPKGKTTWEGFQRPFKDGDVVISNWGDIHLLRTADSSYCAYRELWQKKLDTTTTTNVRVVRLATEEEKQKLFDAIKANGYKWNAEKKELERLVEPKFKVGVMEDFITYELALKLKEKGFREECLCHYVGEDLVYNIESPIANNQLWFSHNKFDNIWHKDNYDAPTISQVLKWLREEKLILIGLSPMQEYDVEETIEWCATVYKADKQGGLSLKDELYYESYELAALAGIEYVLDNLI